MAAHIEQPRSSTQNLALYPPSGLSMLLIVAVWTYQHHQIHTTSTAPPKGAMRLMRSTTTLPRRAGKPRGPESGNTVARPTHQAHQAHVTPALQTSPAPRGDAIIDTRVAAATPLQRLLTLSSTRSETSRPHASPALVLVDPRTSTTTLLVLSSTLANTRAIQIARRSTCWSSALEVRR